MLATLLLLATEEPGEHAETVEEHVDDPTWFTVLFAVVAVVIALYLLYVFVRTPKPAGHHDDHGDDHGDHGHGHDDDAHAGAGAHH